MTRVVGMRRSAGAEVRETLVALVVAAAVELGLRTMPLPRLAAWLGTPLRTDEPPEPPAVETDTAQVRAQLPPWALVRLRGVRRVMCRWPFGGTCLRASLVSGQRLRRLGPALRLGVARRHAGLLAHAWIELGGAPLDPIASRFVPLTTTTRSA